jgi:predicted dehydrogenase
VSRFPDLLVSIESSTRSVATTVFAPDESGCIQMIGIGIVGIGFMGMIHYLASRRVAGAQVVALCSRDPKKLAGDWTSIQGNFGPRGTQMDLSGLALYDDYARMLADPQVHLVDLCVPNDLHGRLAIQALHAGKPVLVEKPIALTIDEADAMVSASRDSGKPLMVGQVLPFVPEFAFAWEAVRSGRYGALRAAHFQRVISKPDWSNEVADLTKSGGPAIDLHIHDTHFVSLLCGVPRAVHSRGVVDHGAVVHLTTQYLFDTPNLAVSCVSGALSQSGRPFTHGFELYLEEATLAFEFANLAGQGHLATPLSVIQSNGTVERPELGSGDPVDGFVQELTAATEAVASNRPSPPLSGELARQALRLCLAEIESVQTGRAIELA